MRARDSDQLAVKLGLPPASMSAFRDLTPEQVELLSDAIDRASARRQEAIDAALRRALPQLPRRLMLTLLRRDGRRGADGRGRGWGPRRSEEGGDRAPPGAAKPPAAQ